MKEMIVFLLGVIIGILPNNVIPPQVGERSFGLQVYNPPIGAEEQAAISGAWGSSNTVTLLVPLIYSSPTYLALGFGTNFDDCKPAGRIYGFSKRVYPDGRISLCILVDASFGPLEESLGALKIGDALSAIQE